MKVNLYIFVCITNFFYTSTKLRWQERSLAVLLFNILRLRWCVTGGFGKGKCVGGWRYMEGIEREEEREEERKVGGTQVTERGNDPNFV